MSVRLAITPPSALAGSKFLLTAALERQLTGTWLHRKTGGCQATTRILHIGIERAHILIKMGQRACTGQANIIPLGAWSNLNH
jgi:hypothetical protein